MENVRSTPEFGAPQVASAQNTEKKRVYEPDGKDVLALFLTWGMGTFLAALLLGPGLPGLGITIGVAIWYGTLFLIRGKKGFGSRAGFWLFLAVTDLALTFSIWSDRWLRFWNMIFLLGLMGVQTVEIYVHAFNIKNIDFEDSFEETIRAKVAAEQEALRKQNETVAKEEEAKQLLIAAEADAKAKLLNAEAEANAKKLDAEAEAYAIEVIQEQLRTSPEYNQLQMIQKWDGKWPTVMGETVNPFVTIGK